MKGLKYIGIDARIEALRAAASAEGDDWTTDLCVNALAGTDEDKYEALRVLGEPRGVLA